MLPFCLSASASCSLDAGHWGYVKKNALESILNALTCYVAIVAITRCNINTKSLHGVTLLNVLGLISANRIASFNLLIYRSEI
jgi:hypothetical protein